MAYCFSVLYCLYDFLHFPCFFYSYFLQVLLRCRLVALSCPGHHAIERHVGEVANELQLFGFACGVCAQKTSRADLFDEQLILGVGSQRKLCVCIGLLEHAAPEPALGGEDRFVGVDGLRSGPVAKTLHGSPKTRCKEVKEGRQPEQALFLVRPLFRPSISRSGRRRRWKKQTLCARIWPARR